MAGILGGEVLTGEDVAEVGRAGVANDLGTLTVGIGNAMDGTGDFGIEAWPAATGVELILGFIEGRVATTADVRTIREVVIVLAREWRLCTFFHDNALLFGSEFVVVHYRSLYGLLRLLL